ncbi:MAG TPA: hypothetical protein VJ964_09010 [Balneolaceae bacterium]|nr:hypothetical protein [Balneolaceae bacterium]
MRTNDLDSLVQTKAQTSLGNHYRDARNLTVLLDNIISGMDAFEAVFDGLRERYGDDFKHEFYKAIR